MARRVSDQLDDDESRFEMLQRLARREEAEEQGEEPPPEPTPHARGLPDRRLMITFPDAAWVDAIRTKAESWGSRPSDLIVKAVSVYMDLVERGEADPPVEVLDQRMRAGEADDLPWDPAPDEFRDSDL
jgi:hypothetical protein